MTNAQCAERAARTLLAYRQLVGESQQSPDEDVIDLLVDLRHHCDHMGLDFEALDQQAARHYVIECASEGGVPCP